jgi:hypothetical protein
MELFRVAVCGLAQCLQWEAQHDEAELWCGTSHLTGLAILTRGLLSSATQKLPSLAISAIERILMHWGVIFQTTIYYIQNSSAA